MAPKKLFLILSVIMPIFFLCVPSQARTIHVPVDFNNIQAAINDANNGDTVIVADGVYTGEGNRDIDFLGKAITVRGENGPNNCIIDCTMHIGTVRYRGFHFYRGEDTNSVLDGLTIKNGLAWNKNGGGILCQNSSPMIRNCIITDNSAEVHMIGGGEGGGIACDGSSPKIINCTITNNTCSFGGGGIKILSGAPTVSNCIISDNVANYGGGIFCYADGSVISNCAITGNKVRMEGAGLLFREGSNASIHNCIIMKNSARQDFTLSEGGGIACDQSSPTIRNCLIAGCSAGTTTSGGWGRGGGISCVAGSNPVISNCTIVYNYLIGSQGDGGGISCYGSNPNMNIVNSILWANTAELGPQIALLPGSTVTVSYCNVQGGQADAYIGQGCSLRWFAGNIVSDPCFADPCNDDYHLKSFGWRWDADANQWTWDNVTSRCIDAGNPGYSLADEPITLLVDPLNRFGVNKRIDMGVYGGTAEASMPPYGWALLSDMDNNGKVNLIDYYYLANYYGQQGENLNSDLNRDGTVNLEDISLIALDWLKSTDWAEN